MLSKWKILNDILEIDTFGKFGYMNGSNEFFAFLKEDDPSSKMPNVLLTGIPKNSILICPDVDSTQPLFLKQENNMRMRCDYILLTKLNGKDIVISIELKSQDYRLSKVESQYNGGDCLLEYLEAVSRKFKNSNISFNLSNIERRYILLYVPDKPSKFIKNMPIPRIGNNTPDKPFEYPLITGGKNNSLKVNYTALVKI